MAVATLDKKRKLIDIKLETFRSLSEVAARSGTSLKQLIENILDNTAENYDDYDKTEMSRWEYFAKIDRARNEKGRTISVEEFEDKYL